MSNPSESAAAPETEHTHSWGPRGTAGVAIPARLRVENLTHRYGAITAVEDVSLDAAPGEIVAVLGQSGCGKTTLLRAIAGVERPSGGSITLDGRCMVGPKCFEPPEKRGIGLVFQDYALFPHLSIRANVAFGLRALSKADAARAADAALARVGMSEHADDYPHHLSGGEQQRVALARAIAPRPGVLLMDEPFSGLDRRLRDSVREETLGVLRETHATSIIVTHDPEEAMRMADRIVLMRGGRVVQQGTPEDLYHRPNSLFTLRFFSETNKIPAKAGGGVAETPLGRFIAPEGLNGPAILGVRHTGIKLLPPGEGVPGRLLVSRFLGEVFALEIAVEGLDAPLRGRLRARPPEQGAEVGVMLDPMDVLVFPATEA